MGAADDGAEQGGCGCSYLGPDLLGGGPVGHDVWVRDVGDYPPHWESVGRIPSLGGPEVDKEATSAREVRSVVLPPVRGGDG